ncbi:MAG: hypothetical protein WBG65_11805 [Sulfurimonadaceae bacterium]
MKNMIAHQRTSTTLDYFILLLLIFISGNLVFVSSTMLIIVFIFSLLLFIYRKKKFDRVAVYFLTFFTVIALLQILKFNFFPVETYIGAYLKILVAYFVVKSIGDSFLEKYIRLMYFIAIISLVVYVLIRVSPGMDVFLIDNFTIHMQGVDQERGLPRFSLGFYTVIPFAIERNSGPFFEPGAFAGYLILALMFNFITEKKKTDIKNIVLLITILSTSSTTGFIALFVFFFFTYYKQVKNIFVKMGAVAIIVLLGFYAYTTFDFLGEKIESQLEYAQEQGIEKSDDSQRFLSISRDMRDLKGHELIGRGGNDLTRYDLHPGESIIIRTVGLTDILVRVGIPFFLYIFYLLYKSIYAYLATLQKKSHIYTIGIFASILVILMSETYFNYPLFWGLLFLQVIYKNTNVKNGSDNKMEAEI